MHKDKHNEIKWKWKRVPIILSNLFVTMEYRYVKCLPAIHAYVCAFGSVSIKTQGEKGSFFIAIELNLCQFIERVIACKH